MKQNSSNKAANSVDDQIVNSDLQNHVQASLSPYNKKNSYGQALKSSAIIGGSSIINIAIGIVRTKCMALLLGPSGIGLMGVFGSILDLTQSIAGMGVNGSGVRQIAEAVGSQDSRRIAITALVLRRTAIFLGLMGAAFLFGFSKQISLFTWDFFYLITHHIHHNAVRKQNTFLA